MNNKAILMLVSVLTIFALYLVFNNKSNSGNLTTTVFYSCDNSKTITAEYTTPVEQNEDVPNPTGSAKITLDSGEPQTLSQTSSTNGRRFANSDESFVFWNTGNEALIMRNNQMDLNYSNCRST